MIVSKLIVDRLNLYWDRFQAVRFRSDSFSGFVSFFNGDAPFLHLGSDFFVACRLFHADNRVVRVANDLRDRLPLYVSAILFRLFRLSANLFRLDGVASFRREGT